MDKFEVLKNYKELLDSGIITQEEFEKTIQAIDSLQFDNAVHITKMADTIVSKKNGIPSVTNELA